MKIAGLLIVVVGLLFSGHAIAADTAPACAKHGNSFLNIDACGAKGDGKTNDAPAIAAAFLNSQNVTCTAGKTYYVASTVKIAADRTTLSANGCRFAPHLNPSTAPILDIEASNVTINGLHVMAGSGGWAIFAGMSKAVAHVMIKK